MEVSEGWGEVAEPSEVVAPVVYQFRPTKFVKVAPERLEAWREYFQENVGLLPEREAASFIRPDQSETISGSYDCWDDCDYV